MSDDLSKRRALREANKALYDAEVRRPRYVRASITQAEPVTDCGAELGYSTSADFAEPPGFWSGFVKGVWNVVVCVAALAAFAFVWTRGGC